jgi:site-specific recombinase XerD
MARRPDGFWDREVATPDLATPSRRSSAERAEHAEDSCLAAALEQGARFLFPSLHGGRLSADAVQFLLRKYLAIAAVQPPSLADKNVTPHVLRHTCAMNLLQRGVDMVMSAGR